MVLLAKQDAKAFTTISLVINTFNVFLFIGAFYLYGLIGLGVAETINVAIQWGVYYGVIRNRYNVSFDRDTNFMLAVILGVVVLSIVLKNVDSPYLRYSAQIVLIIFSVFYGAYWSKKMNLNVLRFVTSRIGGKK